VTEIGIGIGREKEIEKETRSGAVIEVGAGTEIEIETATGRAAEAEAVDETQEEIERAFSRSTIPLMNFARSLVYLGCRESRILPQIDECTIPCQKISTHLLLNL